jgi:hypothetical protein
MATDTRGAGPALIEPKWWTGSAFSDAGEFTIDASALGASELREQMRSRFDAVGLVHVVNTGLTEIEAMRDLARAVIGNPTAYEGGANPRNQIAPNVYEVGAPLSAGLQYHHEMAYVGVSRRSIAFLCHEAVVDDSDTGAGSLRGATFVSDSIAATDALLDTELGRKLRERGVCYHRNLTDRDAFEGRPPIGVYNHWQKSFGTDDPHEAAARARSQLLAVDWDADGTMLTRYYCHAFEYHPGSGRNVLYSSLADHGMWFDTWPNVAHLPYDQRPLDMTFGDGTPFTDDERRLWIDLYDRFGTPIRWKVGDVAVVCNYRFAHGRPGIHLRPGEARTLGVLLGEPFHRVGVRTDAW